MEAAASHPQPLEPGIFLAERRASVSVGSLQYANWTSHSPLRIERHCHAAAHFMLVTSGQYCTTARQSACSNDDVLIYNPASTEHADHLETGGSFFTVTSSSEFSIGSVTPALPQCPIQINLPCVRALMRHLLSELSSWHCDSSMHVEALCAEMVSIVSGHSSNRAPPGWAERAREAIEDTFREPMSLSELAAAIDVHPFHLTRSFRKFFRSTPSEYLRARRLSAAAQQLTRTRCSIAEIALDTGFSDQAHLTKRFSAAYGLSPARFRRLTSDPR